MLAGKRKKDQEMAARMKKEKIARDVGRCPICNKNVDLKHLQNHISFHK